MTTTNIDTMSKIELRAACKAAGVAGYSKMDNAGMRAALLPAAPALSEPSAATLAAAAEVLTESAVTAPAAAVAPTAKTPKVKKVFTSKIAREQRNGVTQPGIGVCRDVWNALDALLTAGTQPTSKEVKELVTAKNWNPNNAGIELSRWRKFNGLSAVRAAKRVEVPPAPATAA